MNAVFVHFVHAQLRTKNKSSLTETAEISRLQICGFGCNEILTATTSQIPGPFAFTIETSAVERAMFIYFEHYNCK